MRSLAPWLLAGVVLLCTSRPVVVAEGETKDSSTTPAACTAAEYRQFDFWLGDWVVQNPDGVVVGSNRIEAILGGCALSESWTSQTGSVGHSFNIYDRSSGRWHQTWVDDGGLLLQLDGGLDDGSMILAQRTEAADGQVSPQRVSWRPRPDGTVRQHWQSSTDGGLTWSTVFDGIYVKKRP